MVKLRETLKLRRKAGEEGIAELLLFPLFFVLTEEECRNANLLMEICGEVFEREGFFEALRQRACSTEEMILTVRKMAAYPGLVYRSGDGETVQEFVLKAAVKVSTSFRIKVLNTRS